MLSRKVCLSSYIKQTLCQNLKNQRHNGGSSAQKLNSYTFQNQLCLQTRCISTGNDAVQGPLHFLNGQRVQPQNTDAADDITLLGPATGTPLCVMRGSGEVDVDNAVQNAKQAFHDWSQSSFKDRANVLYKTAQLIRDNLEELSIAETLHNGKPLWESRMDTDACADTVEFFAGLTSTIAGRNVGFPGHSFGYTRREPLGVIGAIGAFNYPFQMASWKSAPALCTGNTVVFKSSPLTPLTGVMLAEIYKEAGLPDGCFNVIQGEVKPGQFLANHPDISKMTFTGSVPTGTKIMEACAQDIKKVTLELGGKSPVLIFDDCDLDNAVKGTMLANFLTQGQVCSNGTRVYVHKKIASAFLSELVRRTSAIRVGDPMDERSMSGAMISQAQAEKTLRYIDVAKQEGGKVMCGGERVHMPGKLAGGWYVSPCVMSNVRDDMTIAREEVFGPVVSILEFEDEDDVIRRANDSQFGLASGVFTKDIQRAHRIANRLEAGNVYINNYNMYPPQMPFGGYKKSGLGVECGVECLAYFTQNKTVYVEGGDVWSPFE